MIKKTIYVIGWSLGLLFATFPKLFQGEMKFQMLDLNMRNVNESYLFPLIMALSLFVADVCYVFEQEKIENSNNPKYITEVLMLICIFLFGVAYSIASSTYPCVGFIIAWIALTTMKFLKTTKCTKNNKPAISCSVITED